MEHPAPPGDPFAPSSFYLPELLHLRTIAGEDGQVDFLLIDQCVFGSPPVKPTMLLLIHARHCFDKARKMAGRGLCTHRGQPHASCQANQLRGRDERGRFRTGTAKQYPGDLGQFLTKGAVTFSLRYLAESSTPGEPVVEDLDVRIASFFVPLDPYSLDQGWGNYAYDYAPASAC